MSCCSNQSFTCSKSHFSMPLKGVCPVSSFTPAVPAHHFNLYCYNSCPPIVVGASPNHGISCNAYNGYTPTLCIYTPGHTPSCPTTCPTAPCC